jgi:hypothetical protein
MTAKIKKLLMSVEWIVPVLCIFLAGGCEKKNPLDLDYNTFDQRPGKGWRQVAEKGNFLDAARLIDGYAETHKSLDESQRVNLNFHAGQMYAFADDYRTAIDRFNVSTYAEEPPNLPLRWNAYVRATIAFLNKDMKHLEECRKEILEGPTFDGEKANLDVVDGLIKHFDRPYAEAYGGGRD